MPFGHATDLPDWEAGEVMNLRTAWRNEDYEYSYVRLRQVRPRHGEDVVDRDGLVLLDVVNFGADGQANVGSAWLTVAELGLIAVALLRLIWRRAFEALLEGA